jgi:lipopolysaccharide/colanic/teichoic acid biosynthesis glycosyltransferase
MAKGYVDVLPASELVVRRQSIAIVPLWKRVLDLGCILLAAPVVAPLMLLITAYIKLISPGPVFFLQDRVGLKGRLFRCYKFRSMHVGSSVQAHEEYLKNLIHSDTPMAKMDNQGDRRLIPLGRIIRALGLDELPQLINVWKGDMSLVGPRPCTPYEFQHYLPWHKRRCETLPGITGLWQVSGKNKTTFSQMIQFDLDYIEQRSFGGDIKIMLLTFFTLVDQVRDSRGAKESPSRMVSGKSYRLESRTQL